MARRIARTSIAHRGLMCQDREHEKPAIMETEYHNQPFDLLNASL